MLDATDIIQEYISNRGNYGNGKVPFDYMHGELIFLNEIPEQITLFGIYIHPEYRRQGMCRHILCTLIDCGIRHHIKSVAIISVLSKILYEYLKRFRYKTFKFTQTTQGWICRLVQKK